MVFEGHYLIFYIICSYLSKHQQRVLFCGELSECAPQKSILGHLLFAFNINDLSSVVTHCFLNFYVDDADRGRGR